MKKVKFLLVAMMIAFSAQMAAADQIDGLASTSGPAAPASLQDLYVNPGGLGDALLFGYYNARNSINLIRIVNTSTTTGVVGKMRFREGKLSEEVLDFLVCLSPGDQFTAWVVDPALFGLPNGPAMIVKGSNNDTGFLVGDSDTVTVPGGWSTASFKYSATGAASTVTMDDTKEGYFEFIATKGVNTGTTDFEGAHSAFAALISTSEQCSEFALAPNESQTNTPNSLMGEVYVFNFNTAYPSTFNYDATVLANFADEIDNVSTTSDRPLWSHADSGLNGVNYVLTKSSFYAMYDVQSYLQGATDFIVTFPTKKEILQSGLGANYFPHTNVMTPYACTQVEYHIYDDAEHRPTTETGFSPGRVQNDYLCYEVNYIKGGESSQTIFDTALNSATIANIGKAAGSVSFDFGWVEIDFVDGSTSATPDSTVSGIPAVGYEVQTWLGGALDGMSPMKYRVDVEGGQ